MLEFIATSVRPVSALERRLVWILGSPRSGSTWLLNLLAFDRRVVKIDEPAIGAHVAVLLGGLIGLRPERVAPDQMRLNDLRAESPDYFFSGAYETTWRPALRRLILRRLSRQVYDRARRQGVRTPIAVIKEPHGSQGADLLMSALPRSRLLFLLRDGRDVIDSALDAASAGSWARKGLNGYETPDKVRLAFLRDRANLWVCRTVAVQRAFNNHAPARRMLIRYEDLLAEPEQSLASVTAWAGLRLDATQIREATEATSAEAIPVAQRGRGQFVRAARAGTWRENWTEQERDAVEEIVGPKLRELGYE